MRVCVCVGVRVCVVSHLVYEPQGDQLCGEGGGGVSPGDGARQLAVHLVVHTEQDRHLQEELA